VTRADLFEVSIVTRAAYDAAQIAARNWTLRTDGETGTKLQGQFVLKNQNNRATVMALGVSRWR
jgi:phage head maturation protease